MSWQNWYSLAKTEGEEMALEYGNRNGLHVVTVCPGIVFGPMLQTVQLNTTTKALLYIIQGCMILVFFSTDSRTHKSVIKIIFVDDNTSSRIRLTNITMQEAMALIQ